MRILVTGGSGFIGSHLCKSLLEESHEVICVDNNFSSDKGNVHDLLEFKNFEFLRHDITQPLYVEVDQIYNLACPASPIHYQRNPVQTLKTCVHGAINMLGVAKRTGARILQASTSEVYGDPNISPQVEDYWGHVNPIGIRSCYDEGKRAAECLFMDYHRSHNVDIKIARIFNTYGPNMMVNDGRVVSNFINQCLDKSPVTIYGDGSQTRSFCYVSDLVNGLKLLMASDTTGPINLGNPRESTILDIYYLINEKLGMAPSIVNLPLPSDDPKVRNPDISKARSVLGWNPNVELEDGIEKTIEYFKSIR